jgi:hypothetical protein
MTKKPKLVQPSTEDLTNQLLGNLLPRNPKSSDADQSTESASTPPPPEVAENDPEPTVTLPPVPEAPTMEGFSMEDVSPRSETADGASTVPDGLDLGQLVREAAARPVAPAPEEIPAATAVKEVAKQVPLEGELSRGTGLRYESRIEILDAFQYPGNVATAPVWVDRNWIGFADPDDLRGMPASPCLRVPTFRGDIVVCRPGDYVCRQSVKLIEGQQEIRLEVWPREQFERLFLPAGSKSEAA